MADPIEVKPVPSEIVAVPKTNLIPKDWYKSFGIWGSILIAVSGGISGVSNAVGHPIDVKWLAELGAALAAFGIRKATQPIG